MSEPWFYILDSIQDATFSKSLRYQSQYADCISNLTKEVAADIHNPDSDLAKSMVAAAKEGKSGIDIFPNNRQKQLPCVLPKTDLSHNLNLELDDYLIIKECHYSETKNAKNWSCLARISWSNEHQSNNWANLVKLGE